MTGRHRGQDRDPGTATLSQREMIEAWTAALSLPDTGRHARSWNHPASPESLSEHQAGDLLQALWRQSLTFREPRR